MPSNGAPEFHVTLRILMLAFYSCEPNIWNPMQSCLQLESHITAQRDYAVYYTTKLHQHSIAGQPEGAP